MAPLPCTTAYTKRWVTAGMINRDCRPEGPQPAVALAAKLQPNVAHEAGQPKPANNDVLIDVKPTAEHVSSTSGRPSGALPRSITKRCCGHASVEKPVDPHEFAPKSDGVPKGTPMRPVKP